MPVKTINAWEARSLTGMVGDAVNAPNLEKVCKEVDKQAKLGKTSCECAFECSDSEAHALCSALQTLGFRREWARNDEGKAVVKVDWSGT